MGDESASPLEKLTIFISEDIGLFAFGVEHSDNVTMAVGHRNNDLGAGGMERREITRVFAHVPDHDRLARFEGGTAKALGNWKSWIRGRFVTSPGQNYEFFLGQFINTDPSIISGSPDHFDDIFQSFRRAAAGQDKRADLLQGLARLSFHSWES
jgi:hypothetical protein